MRTRHGITQLRGFKRILRSSQFQSFLNEHPEAQRRWSVLRPVHDKTITQRQAALTFGIDERTIRRWREQYEEGNWYSLLSASRTPKTTPRTLSPHWMHDRVRELANEHRAWGAPKIADHIAFHDAHDRRIPKRTVSRLLARGLEQKDILPRVKLKQSKQMRRDVRGRTINRIKNSTEPAMAPGERVHNDGVIVQIFLAAENMMRRLYFSATIDRFSKVGMVVVGESLNAALTIQSHCRLQRILGETIVEKISDNGGENLGDCVEFYEGENIIQLFTYPHAPKQNAVCERFNRTFQEECLLARRIDLTQSIEVIQEQINAWLVFYNTVRTHESLGGIPPVLALFRWKFKQLPQDRQANALCGHMLWRGTGPCASLRQVLYCMQHTP